MTQNTGQGQNSWKDLLLHAASKHFQDIKGKLLRMRCSCLCQSDCQWVCVWLCVWVDLYVVGKSKCAWCAWVCPSWPWWCVYEGVFLYSSRSMQQWWGYCRRCMCVGACVSTLWMNITVLKVNSMTSCITPPPPTQTHTSTPTHTLRPNKFHCLKLQMFLLVCLEVDRGALDSFWSSSSISNLSISCWYCEDKNT